MKQLGWILLALAWTASQAAAQGYYYPNGGSVVSGSVDRGYYNTVIGTGGGNTVIGTGVGGTGGAGGTVISGTAALAAPSPVTTWPAITTCTTTGTTTGTNVTPAPKSPTYQPLEETTHVMGLFAFIGFLVCVAAVASLVYALVASIAGAHKRVAALEERFEKIDRDKAAEQEHKERLYRRSQVSELLGIHDDLAKEIARIFGE